MATELFANNPSTTLASGALSGDATITVASSTGFPAAVTGTSQFRILVESEIMIVTNVSGTTWTVTRGAESTTAAAHSSGVAVTHVVTAAALKNLDAADILNGTLLDARFPTRVGTVGTQLTSTDNLDTITQSGWYWHTSASVPTNAAVAATAITYSVFSRASNYTIQVAYVNTTGVTAKMYVRTSSAGTFSAWTQVLLDGDNLNASNLSSGTVPAARLRSTSLWNGSVTTPAAGFASDTYLVGSSIAVPASSLQAKSQYRLKFSVSKTAAGTAAPVVTIRFGTAGSTADTSICALTFAAQTAAIDEGFIEVFATFRTVGSGTSAVVQGVGTLAHRLAATGLSTSGASVVTTTGAGFDSTLGSAIIGASVNGGTSAAWTITLVQAELFNLV